MAKPRAVRDAASRADELISNNQGDTAVDGTEGGDGTADTAQLSVVQSQLPAENTPETTAQPSQDDTVESLRVQRDQAIKERDQMEERWRTMDGMLRTANEKLEGLRNLIANSQAAQAERGDKGGDTSTRSGDGGDAVDLAAKVYSASDADRFGEDLCEFIEQMIHSIARPAIANLAKQMQGMSASVEDTTKAVALTQQDRYEQKLTSLCPKWRQHDADPKFVEWLKANPFYARGFKAAVEDMDAPSTAQVFKVFEGEQAAAAVPAKTADDKRSRQLEGQVQPETTRGEAAPTRAADANQPKVWKMSEIHAVYADLKRPKQQRKYTHEQFDALERDIAAAQAEGRVTYD